MYLRADNKLLRTKIVATIGAPHDRIFDPQDGFIAEWEKKFRSPEGFYDAFLRWFVQPNQSDFYMIDIIRLNMSFAKKEEEEIGEYGRNERLIFEWLKEHKGDLVKNVAVLGDLPGPKLRVGDIGEGRIIHLKKDHDTFKLYFGKRELQAAGGSAASILVQDEVLGKAKGIDYQRLLKDIKKRLPFTVFIADGDVILKAIGVDESEGFLKCVVEKEGEVRDDKGVTIRGLPLDLPAFQEGDKRAIDFLLEHGYDWDEDPTDPSSLGSFLGFIGVSFVKSKEDILEVKQYIEDQLLEKYQNANPWKTALQRMKEAIKGQGHRLNQDELEERAARLLSPAIIAKIETPQAWENIDEILDVADGAMVARGDLGLQLDPEEVPAIQKKLIRLCNLRGKIAITATQMLESMKDNQEPTRAEATDVFNAILDGSDAVMLSGETAEGKYPFHAVLMMAKIAEKAELHIENFGRRQTLSRRERRRLNEQRYEELLVGAEEIVDENTRRLRDGQKEASWKGDRWTEELYRQKALKSEKQGTTDRISLSACRLAESDGCRAIITPTASGRTTRMIARFRPSVPIIGVTHDTINRRKLLISFGVYPINIGMVYKKSGRVFENIEEMFEQACTELRNYSYIMDIVMGGQEEVEAVFTAGTPLFEPGTTNLVQIRKVTK